MGVMISGGEMGFDEGGVLQALSKPFYKREFVNYTYFKNGKLKRKETGNYDVSWMDILAGACVIFGPIVLMQFYTKVFTDENKRKAAEGFVRMQLAPFMAGRELDMAVARAFTGLVRNFSWMKPVLG